MNARTICICNAVSLILSLFVIICTATSAFPVASEFALLGWIYFIASFFGFYALYKEHIHLLTLYTAMQAIHTVYVLILTATLISLLVSAESTPAMTYNMFFPIADYRHDFSAQKLRNLRVGLVIALCVSIGIFMFYVFFVFQLIVYLCKYCVRLESRQAEDDIKPCYEVMELVEVR